MANGTIRLLNSARRLIAPSLRHFSEKRQPVIWLLAPLIGLATGVAAIIFRLAIGAIQWPWLHDMSESVAAAARQQPWWLVLLAPIVGGLVVGLLLQYVVPGKRVGAVADVMEARVKAGGGLSLWQGLTSAAASAVSLGSGASAGREGPIVHLGATLAVAACRRLGLPDSARRTILGCGVAGAVAASFNAPIAGVLFAQEVILGHFAVGSFAPLVLSAVVATIVSQAWFGDVAAFVVPDYHIASALEIPAFLLLGVICAGVAILFQAAVVSADWIARTIQVPLMTRPVIGGAMIGVMAIWFPEVLGVGYDTTDAALKNELPLTLLFVLIFAKTAATAITLASRGGGGVFSPALYLGAMTGAAFGIIATGIFPDTGSSEGLYAILGMGAVAAAVLGAPISTTVMVFELTGGYALSVALLLTVAVSNGLSVAVLGRSLFQTQLEQRGYVMHEGSHKVIMRRIAVHDFMRRPDPDADTDLPEGHDGPVLLSTDTLETALRLFDQTGADGLPVVDPTDRSRIVGFATETAAITRYNRALVAASEEEHR